jgi:hypothetical protein
LGRSLRKDATPLQQDCRCAQSLSSQPLALGECVGRRPTAPLSDLWPTMIRPFPVAHFPAALRALAVGAPPAAGSPVGHHPLATAPPQAVCQTLRLFLALRLGACKLLPKVLPKSQAGSQNYPQNCGPNGEDFTRKSAGTTPNPADVEDGLDQVGNLESALEPMPTFTSVNPAPCWVGSPHPGSIGASQTKPIKSSSRGRMCNGVLHAKWQAGDRPA